MLKNMRTLPQIWSGSHKETSMSENFSNTPFEQVMTSEIAKSIGSVNSTTPQIPYALSRVMRTSTFKTSDEHTHGVPQQHEVSVPTAPPFMMTLPSEKVMSVIGYVVLHVAIEYHLRHAEEPDVPWPSIWIWLASKSGKVDKLNEPIDIHVVLLLAVLLVAVLPVGISTTEAVP